MAMSEEQKAKLREELDKLTPDEIKDLNIALRESLDEERATARTERQKALYAFLHPDKGLNPDAPNNTDNEQSADDIDPYFEKLQNRFKMR